MNAQQICSNPSLGASAELVAVLPDCGERVLIASAAADEVDKGDVSSDSHHRHMQII